MARVPSVVIAVTLAFAVFQVQSTTADSDHPRCGENEDCKMSEWSPVEACNATGFKNQTRSVLVPSKDRSPCPPTEMTTRCSERECWMGAWGDWVCDPNTGNKQRTRAIAPGGLQDPKKCPAKAQQAPCDPVACVVNSLAEDVANPWGECTLVGGVWTKTKLLGIKTPALFGGTPCSDASRVVTATCDPVDCKWSSTEYDAWTACDADHVKYHPFKITQQPLYGGLACPPVEQRADKALCPVDCVVSDWSLPGDCAQNAATGAWEKTSTRTVTTPDQNGGLPCGQLTKKESCAVDCKYVETPTSCALSAGFHWEKSRVTVTAPPLYGGAACPSPKPCDWAESCDALADTEKTACRAAVAHSGALMMNQTVLLPTVVAPGLQLWECASKCETTTKCRAFTYDPSTSTCSITTKPSYTIVGSTGRISATITYSCSTPQEHTDFSGYDIPWSGKTVGSIEECCNRCKDDAQCTVYSLVGTWCLLKTSSAGARDVPGITSGSLVLL